MLCFSLYYCINLFLICSTQSATKHQMFRSKMDSSVPFPASPLTSPDLTIGMGAGQRQESSSPSPYSFPVEPPSSRNTPSPSIMTQTPEIMPPRNSSPSMTTHTPLESRSLNSSNSKDSSGGQPLSENLDSKGVKTMMRKIVFLISIQEPPRTAEAPEDVTRAFPLN